MDNDNAFTTVLPGLKAQFAFGMVFLFVQPDASAADISAQQIGGVIIPQAFSQALQDGMSVPLYIHLAGSQVARRSANRQRFYLAGRWTATHPENTAGRE